MKISLIATLGAAFLTSGCADYVTLENASSETVSNLVIATAGSTNRFEILLPGAHVQITPDWRGGSGVRVMFDARGEKFDSDEQGYFEGREGHVRATIQTNFAIFVGRAK